MSLRNRPPAFTGLAALALVLSSALAPAQDLYDEAVLRTVKLTFTQPGWYQQLIQNRASGTNLQASLEVDGRTYPGVGVRFKGQASYSAIGNSEKKPFKIVVDWTQTDQRLYGATSLNLHNGFRDPTFCREVATYHFMRRYMPAPRANFVKLEINGQNWGVYTNIEQVDKRFMADWYADNDGNRYKGDGTDQAPVGGTALTWLGTNQAPYQQSYELKTPNNPGVWTDLIRVCDRLNNTQSSQFRNTLDPYFAIDNALWYLAACNVFAALDTYIGAGHNFYLLVDDTTGRMDITPWDLGESFGAFPAGLSVQQVKLIEPDHNRSHPFRPLIARLLSNPAYESRYVAHLQTLLDEVWSWSEIGPLVTRYRSLIRAEVAADPKKLYTLSMFDQNFSIDVTLPGTGRAGGSVPGLQSIVDTRRGYLVTHPMLVRSTPSLDNLARTPSGPPLSTDNVIVTVRAKRASAVMLHYSTGGAFADLPMFDDGNHGDGAAGDEYFGATIPAQAIGTRVRYYTSALSSSAGSRFEPRGTERGAHEYVVQSPIGTSVLIHELMAINNTVLADSAGEFDDWFELVNPTAAAVDIGGMFLSDDPTNPARWQIPAGTSIAPGAVMLFWADDDGGQGPRHTNFRLTGAGEHLVLTDRDGRSTLDTITFGQQFSDVSQGRAPHGGGVWVLYPDPTPGAVNSAPRCGTRRYTAFDPSGLPGGLAVSGAMRIGTTPSFTVARMGASRPVIVLLATRPANTVLGFAPGALMLEAPVFTAALGVTATDGSASLPIPIINDASLDGAEFFVQAWSLGSGTLAGSQALATTICR